MGLAYILRTAQSYRATNVCTNCPANIGLQNNFLKSLKKKKKTFISPHASTLAQQHQVNKQYTDSFSEVDG